MGTKTYFDATEYQNVKEILYGVTEKIPNHTAFILKRSEKGASGETLYDTISYQKFLETVNYLGTALFEEGYEDKRIAIVGRNKYEWVLTHLANLLGGIVSAPIDKELQQEELEQCIARSKADAVVFDNKYLDKIEIMKAKEFFQSTNFICMEKQEGYQDIHTLIQRGEELVKGGKRDFIDYQIDNDRMNILLFTSGTSSKSKAVMLSQKNIASNIYAMQLVEPLHAGDTTIAFLPLHHVFGSTCVIMMLASGVATAFPDGIRYIAQNLKEYGVSIFVGVPVLVEAIYKNIKKEIKKQGKERIVNFARKASNTLRKVHVDVRRQLFKSILEPLGGKLKYIIAGGAALDRKVSEYFDSIGVGVLQGYGLTETAPVLAAENYRMRRPGSIGVPLSNVNFEIFNQDANGIGEVRVKGPNIMIGYYEDEAQTKEVIQDGWFYTGDLGYIDKDGFIFLTGRKKDMIVLKNGKKVFPEEIETIINRLDIVEESMVFGLPEADGDIKLSVKIVYNKDVAKKEYPDKSFEELKEIIWQEIKEINKQFPTYKYIKNLILTDEELIKTTTKKVKRQEEMKRILSELK